MADSFDAPETLEALLAEVTEIERTNEALRKELRRPPKGRWEPDRLDIVLLAVLVIETLAAFSVGYHMMSNFDPNMPNCWNAKEQLDSPCPKVASRVRSRA